MLLKFDGRAGESNVKQDGSSSWDCSAFGHSEKGAGLSRCALGGDGCGYSQPSEAGLQVADLGELCRVPCSVPGVLNTRRLPAALQAGRRKQYLWLLGHFQNLCLPWTKPNQNSAGKGCLGSVNPRCSDLSYRESKAASE